MKHSKSKLTMIKLATVFFAFGVLTCILNAEDVKLIEISEMQLNPVEIPQASTKVELRKNLNGDWRIYLDETEFPIRGAGGAVTPGFLEQLKLAGGNCVRTWGIDALDKKMPGDELFIDRAYRLGIMVVPGIWIGHERHGFNYSDPAAVKKQRDEVLNSVKKYKNHPGVLVWGLGNEMEGPSSQQGSIAVFKEIEELAKLIKSEDPNHPVMTVIAYNPAKIPNILTYCPSIDILGVNTYGGAAGIGEGLRKTGWKKPFAVTEFGVKGFWEVPVTEWGAPLEPTSQEKAAQYFSSHTLVFDTNDGKELCLGTFAFLWGWKQERTSTWFGMFLPTLEKLPQVDAMTKAWLGKWPANRCPKITEFSSEAYGKTIKPGITVVARVEAVDPEGDVLSYDWMVFSEATDLREGGEAESAPASHPQLIKQNNAKDCVFASPETPGNYRLFLTVRDNRGGAATANFPFRVK